MAKLYSEKLNKYYEMSEADVLAAEEAAYDAEMAEIEAKKADKEARLHEVEDAYDAAYEAYIKAIDLKDKYVEDDGLQFFLGDRRGFFHFVLPEQRYYL